MVVALNKIDRPESNVDDVVLDLAKLNVELDEVGGNVPSARISALNNIGLEILEKKII